jgi:hypothetical protein
MLLNIGVKKLGFESGEGFDLLNSEKALGELLCRSVERFFGIMSEVCIPRYILVIHKYRLN